MRLETLSVREAREMLPTVLDRFRNGDRTPVGVGSHRKTEAVMLPVEVYDEFLALLAERAAAVADAIGSVRAEGLTPSGGAKEILDRWSRGEISEARMYELIEQLHGTA
jgi:PHD/YefM family antitoxin component YafN of YafNO toxin-antitoxin module